MEGGARAVIRHAPQLPGVLLDDGPADREAHPQTTGLRRVERLKHPRRAPAGRCRIPSLAPLAARDGAVRTDRARECRAVIVRGERRMGPGTSGLEPGAVASEVLPPHRVQEARGGMPAALLDLFLD
jgi:hypothetical protein